MNDYLNIVLNGTIVKGFPGETILQLAERHGIKIPTLCNDPRLEPYSSCYVCVVEVKGMRGHQPSCSTRIAEGMEIITDNDAISKSRKTALDLILSNHYADCLGPCKQTCPAGVDVQGYIALIDKGLYSEAIGVIKENNPLPAICGRVCVRPCEVACRRNLLGEGTGVGLDYLKRFAADIDLEAEDKFVPEVKAATGKKVAIIGAGPGGLSAAYYLQIEGHQCDIYEAAPKSGGWLRYGIPEYRLPNDILDKEVKNITDLGVNIHYNQRLGDNLSYETLSKQYDATVLAIGSQKGTRVGCEGDDAANVFSGIDFLKTMEVTGEKMDFRGKTVAVVGGGNTAMDCCRTSIRCGAEKVYVIYRRTEAEMPANPIEIHESKLEGVEYLFLTNPTKINKHADGSLKSVTCIRMELGEPDASGRRRPVPVEGSEYDIELDYMLAAIGQKTDINFLENVNAFAKNGQLKPNKWGDIEANAKTLQTGIHNMFACGDAVSGPATIIEAVAQAKKAALSCHQFLTNQPIEPLKKEFISRKDNFKDQQTDAYQGRYSCQSRHEMPVLDPEKRLNFSEVELGYENEEVALNEAQRCLECGCTEYYTCDLKKYATQYGADQKHFDGEFREYQVDFRHPFIEIDNNKCVLCSRCVRICREVVGAGALGLVNRGFDTFVAPSMGDSLTDTPCESCGLCISACPTGAITENVPFKPGPVETEEVPTIDFMGSEGFEISLKHRKGFIFRTDGRKGTINQSGNINRRAKFGYRLVNDSKRILKPLLRHEGGFKEISFEEALHLMVNRINAVKPIENAFTGGARLTNEELYLIQKLARGGVKTPNVNSFHYMGRGKGYLHTAEFNVPFNDLPQARNFFVLGCELTMDHPVISFIVNATHYTHKAPINLITIEENALEHKASTTTKIKSYYHFVKAANHYLISQGLQNELFINTLMSGFDNYKQNILAEDYAALLAKAGVTATELEAFANGYNDAMNAVLIFSEKQVSGATAVELANLSAITGKTGKTAMGLVALKECCNSQGIIDNGIRVNSGPGLQELTDRSFVEKLEKAWGVSDIPAPAGCTKTRLEDGVISNLFVFGEDPIGCAIDKERIKGWFSNLQFTVVMDYFMTETAQQADLVLPASFPFELGGSFSNTQKNIQTFQAGLKPKPAMTSYAMLLALHERFGLATAQTPEEIFLEFAALLPGKHCEQLSFEYTSTDDGARLFYAGADGLLKRFDNEFEAAF